VDGRAGNAGMFGAEQFARMPKRSLFLNLSRGFVVDHEALRENILSGHIAGAAIDVFPDEPKAQGDPFVSTLRGLPNVILTPHVGGSTQEAQRNLGVEVSEKLCDYLARGAVRGSVNLPELGVGALRGSVRIVHLHRDRPGVMSHLNGVLAGAGLNVTQLHLETDGSVGVAVVDLDGPLESGTLGAVQAIPGTLASFVAGSSKT
jgi:D-3-phosphoglycerate dehydrogenase